MVTSLIASRPSCAALDRGSAPWTGRAWCGPEVDPVLARRGASIGRGNRVSFRLPRPVDLGERTCGMERTGSKVRSSGRGVLPDLSEDLDLVGGAKWM